ncbi:unnamed protein product, partial [Ectocarpus sp. 12 AP-2014]
AIGAGSQATGAQSLALGTSATAPTVASGTRSIAQGHGARATADNSVAIGHEASSSGASGVALGFNASATALDGVALGRSASATAVDGVALGSNSVAATASGRAGYVPTGADDTAIAATTSNHGTRVDFTGTDGTRTLAGVSAGAVNAQSTDAINGSQLFGTSESVASGLGGGSVVNDDGTVSAPSYALTDADGNAQTVGNVGDALSQVDGRIAGNTDDIADL